MINDELQTTLQWMYSPNIEGKGEVTYQPDDAGHAMPPTEGTGAVRICAAERPAWSTR